MKIILLPMLTNTSPLEWCWWRDELTRHCLDIVLQCCLEEDESLDERSEETFNARSTNARLQTSKAIQFTSSSFLHLHRSASAPSLSSSELCAAYLHFFDSHRRCSSKPRTRRGNEHDGMERESQKMFNTTNGIIVELFHC